MSLYEYTFVTASWGIQLSGIIVVLCFAGWFIARVLGSTKSHSGLRKYRPFFVLVAIGAYMVKRLGVLVCLLYRINENSRTKFGKFISNCGIFPVQKIHEFFSDFTIRIQQFMILRLSIENKALEENNGIC